MMGAENGDLYLNIEEEVTNRGMQAVSKELEKAGEGIFP